MPKLRDVVEMRWDGIKAYWIGTPFTNIPFTLARFKKRVFEGQSGTKVYKTNEELPKGTFYMIVNNGENPIEILLKRKSKKEEITLNIDDENSITGIKII